jgi:hypothetical protein
MSEEKKAEAAEAKPLEPSPAGEAVATGAPPPAKHQEANATAPGAAEAVTKGFDAGETAAGTPAPQARRWPVYAAHAAALAAAAYLGWLGAWTFLAARTPPANPAHEALAAFDWNGLVGGLQKNEAQFARLMTDAQLLKSSLGGVKETVDRSKAEAGQRLAQIAERLERLQKAEQDAAAKLVAVGERLDRAEGDAKPKLAAIVERLERIERQMTAPQTAAAKPVASSAPAVSPAPVVAEAPAQTASVPDAKPATQDAKADLKPAPIPGWVLHDVHNGRALIEGRNRLHEIGPGQSLPGVGRVEAIERRGRAWVVVTSKGLITSQQW